jgi:hypothetical protein
MFRWDISPSVSKSKIKAAKGTNREHVAIRALGNISPNERWPSTEYKALLPDSTALHDHCFEKFVSYKMRSKLE